MNVRRGLFRIWVILSTVWVLFILSSSYSGVKTDFQKQAALSAAKTRLVQDTSISKYEVTSPEGKKFIVTAPKDATQDQIIAYAKEKVAATPSGNPFDQFDSDYPHPWRKLLSMVFLMAYFPGGAIALWFAGAWVYAGFRSKKSN